MLRKSCRTLPGAPLPLPLPPLPCLGASAIASFQRSIEVAREDDVFTPSPRSYQNACRPSGPRSSWSESTALSTTATETSARTPVPVWSVTLMA